jgi:hypothetical protein
LVPHRDATVVVSTAVLGLLLEKRTVWLAFVQARRLNGNLMASPC